MRKIRPLTPEGKRIKKALIDMGMSQADFCKQYGIHTQRLTDIMHTEYTTNKALKVRLQVYKILREMNAISFASADENKVYEDYEEKRWMEVTDAL